MMNSQEFMIADVVIPTAGKDQGRLFYVLQVQESYLMLVNGKDRPVTKPKRKKGKHAVKVLRSETRVAEKLRAGDKVLDSELREDLAILRRVLQSNA